MAWSLPLSSPPHHGAFSALEEQFLNVKDDGISVCTACRPQSNRRADNVFDRAVSAVFKNRPEVDRWATFYRDNSIGGVRHCPCTNVMNHVVQAGQLHEVDEDNF